MAIESLSSLLQLLLILPLGLYIDIYSGPKAVKLLVSDAWLQLEQLLFIKIVSDSTNFVSGYNVLVSINQGLYFYVFPGKGKGDITIDQHRLQIDPALYTVSTSYSSYYGVSTINGQTDYLIIQASGLLLVDPDPSSDSLTLYIKHRLNL